MPNPFAVIIPAASGVGLELSRIAARQGYDVLIAADEPAIQDVVAELQYEGIYVEALEVDLSSSQGVESVLDAADSKDIGAGLRGAFLQRDITDWRHGLDGGITGTLHLIQHVLPAMVRRGAGRVLVTGVPPAQDGAVYRGARAFFEAFTQGLRADTAQTSGVVLTTLIAPARMTHLPLNEAGLAQQAWDAMMAGERPAGSDA